MSVLKLETGNISEGGGHHVEMSKMRTVFQK